MNSAGLHHHPACFSPDQLLKQCRQQRTRRSGPGGQRRNKVETAVILVHMPTGIRAEANESRSPEANRKQALFRLRIELALAVRDERNGPHEPTALWQSRCRNGRIAVNPTHADFPALLAEALDVAVAVDGDTRQAAAALQLTHSQLVRFLKLQPRALAIVNALRRERGLVPLQ